MNDSQDIRKILAQLKQVTRQTLPAIRPATQPSRGLLGRFFWGNHDDPALHEIEVEAVHEMARIRKEAVVQNFADEADMWLEYKHSQNHAHAAMGKVRALQEMLDDIRDGDFDPEVRQVAIDLMSSIFRATGGKRRG